MGGVLITGAAGMVGSHLLECLAAESTSDLLGTYFRPTIRFEEIADRLPLRELDVRCFEPVRRIVAERRPAVIFHLAAQSLPTRSWENPWETMDVNIQGTLNLFEAIRALRRARAPSYDPMVVVACSSAQYGASLASGRLPVEETAPMLPLHPYGVSKVAQDLLAYQYWCNDKIRCIRARIFNCTGPRKRDDVVSDFARRVAQFTPQTGSHRLRVGNLATRRAILDVRDLISALRMVAHRGEPGEAYNICAERLASIGDLIPILEDLSGLRLEPAPDQSLFRPSDEPVIYGRTEKLRLATGWQPQITLRETVAAVFAYEQGRREQSVG